MLVLDFDGVVCDALLECAAVTWHAPRILAGRARPRLAAAIAAVPADFRTTFAAVRAFSRTLDDFMVANSVPAGTLVDRDGFDRHRASIGAVALAAQAAAGEELRARWRDDEPDRWLAVHHVFPHVAQLLNRGDTAGAVAIVSAKDSGSIQTILRHHRLDQSVKDVVGSCHDKPAALLTLSANGTEPITFVDDSVENAIAASAVPGVTARWATWGYHGLDDAARASAAGVQPISLDEIAAWRSREPATAASIASPSA